MEEEEEDQECVRSYGQALREERMVISTDAKGRKVRMWVDETSEEDEAGMFWISVEDPNTVTLEYAVFSLSEAKQMLSTALNEVDNLFNAGVGR